MSAPNEISFLPSDISHISTFAYKSKVTIKGSLKDSPYDIVLSSSDLVRMFQQPNKTFIARKKISLYYLDPYEDVLPNESFTN